MTMTKHNGEQERTISQLKRDWEQIDELADNDSSVMKIKEQVMAYKVKRKQAFYKELGLFILTALFTLTLIITTVFQAPIVFMTIQAAAAFVVPVAYILYKRSRREGAVRS